MEEICKQTAADAYFVVLYYSIRHGNSCGITFIAIQDGNQLPARSNI